jgi:hypothetical protein
MYDQESSAKSESQNAPGIDKQWLGKWLLAFEDQQRKQTKYLRNISTVATLIGLLLIFGFIFGACSALGTF